MMKSAMAKHKRTRLCNSKTVESARSSLTHAVSLEYTQYPANM